MKIRPATRDDAESLDPIAFAAKAHWGYSREQLHLWKQELTTPPDSIDGRPTFVAEVDGKVVAFAQTDPSVEPWELVALWVLPRFMGRGLGRALLRASAAAAKAAGQDVLAIDSDPHAEAFYLACGARNVGRIPAPIAEDEARARPQLLLDTGPARDPS